MVYYDWQAKVWENAKPEDLEDIIKLYQVIYNYTQKSIEPNMSELSRANRVLFSEFREKYDEDTAKYEAKCKVNRVNGLNGGAPKGNANARKQPKTTQNNPKQPDIRYKIKDNKNSPTKVVEEKEKENFPPPPQSVEPLKGFENIEVVGATATPAPTACEFFRKWRESYKKWWKCNKMFWSFKTFHYICSP